jgi:hypothetical protein
MRHRLNAAKAIAQIIRNDPEGYERYRAELQYRHFKPRYVLAMDAPSHAA